MDLNKNLVHEDFLHIQEKLNWKIAELEDMEISCVLKSGLRDGAIQLAIKHEKGVEWYKEVIPTIPPKNENDTKYQFYGPGEKPFTTFKTAITDLKAAENTELVKKLILGQNKFLRDGYVSVANAGVANSLGYLRIRVGSELLAPLAERDHTIFFSMGTLRLTPVFGGIAPEEEKEVMEVA